MEFQYQVNSLIELEPVSKKIIELLQDQKLVLFNGDLGAGKTTLIKNICKLLGVKDGVNSPTYSIVNEYEIPEKKQVFHFDFYRINDESEAYDLGFDEYLESGSICLVEWPEKIKNLLPSHFIAVNIEVIHNQRLINIYTENGR